MSCECADSGTEVVFHRRLLPYTVWVEYCDKYFGHYENHPIIKREVEMGKAKVKKLLPDALHDHISWNLSSMPFYSKQESDGSYKEENRQIELSFMLRLK